METCLTCVLQNKRSNENNDELTNTHLAVNNRFCCSQCKQKKLSS